MTAGGWITMFISVGFVTSLFTWCIWRVLTHKPKHLHAMEDIDTQDQDD